MTRPGDIARSLAFYVAFYGGTFVFVVAALVMLPISKGAFRWLSESWSGWHRWCVVHLLGIEVRVEGVQPPGSVLFAIKHESFFEAIDMPNLLSWPGVFAKAELLRIPMWGYVGRLYGLIEVQRDQGAKALRAMLASAKAITAQGRPLAIFPEGTRVPHGQVRELQAGFAGLYKLLGLPVVPVAVNSGALYHRRWKRGGTIIVRFGEVIPPGLPRDEVEARVQAAINQLNTPA